jgi:ABC-type transport system involved in multi-copper enzyme maturation permease subunit
VDVVVAKPIWRYEIFLGKYLGGLALYCAALLVTYLLIFLGIGIRTGVWHAHWFRAIPVTVYSVALLYSLVALVGVLTRRTALAIIVGYVFYFVFDTGIWLLQQADRALPDVEWIATLSEWSRYLFPGFQRLKDAAGAAVMSVPLFDWQPVLVGLVWWALCLGLGYWRFHRLDL